MNERAERTVSRAKNAKGAKVEFDKTGGLGGAFASLACLARGQSESGEESFSQRRKDAKVRSEVGMGLIPKTLRLGALARENLEPVLSNKLQDRI